MGTKLETSEGKNLYEFWGNKVQDNVLEELKNQKSDLLIILASKEYFTVLGKLPEDVNVVTPTFKDYKNGKQKVIGFFVGQILKATNKKCNPAEAKKKIEQYLKNS